MIGNPNYSQEEVDVTVKQLSHTNNQVSKKSNISIASSSYEQLQNKETGCIPIRESLERNGPSRKGSDKYMDMSLSNGQFGRDIALPKPTLGREEHYSIVMKK